MTMKMIRSLTSKESPGMPGCMYENSKIEVPIIRTSNLRKKWESSCAEAIEQY